MHFFHSSVSLGVLWPWVVIHLRVTSLGVVFQILSNL